MAAGREPGLLRDVAVDHQRWHGPRGARQVLTGHHRPHRSGLRVDADELQGVFPAKPAGGVGRGRGLGRRGGGRVGELHIAQPELQDRFDLRQAAERLAQRGRVGQERAGERRRVGGQDADVEPGAIQEIAKRQHQAARQQQHVEQQRADCSDAENRQRAPRRLADQGEPGKRQHRWVNDGMNEIISGESRPAARGAAASTTPRCWRECRAGSR